MLLSQRAVSVRRVVVGISRKKSHPMATSRGVPKCRFLASNIESITSTNTATATARESAQDSASASASSPNLSSSQKTAAVALACLSVGFACGRWTGKSPLEEQKGHHHHEHPHHVLPSGLPRTCCDKDEAKNNKTIELTNDQKALHGRLCKIVGKENVLLGTSNANNVSKTLPFLKGARLGHGSCLYIVTPTRLQEVVDAVEAIVQAGCVVLPQGQNTGLTGGSVPRGIGTTSDDRPIVLLSMKHLNRIFPIDNGDRMVCLAGAGLSQLQQYLDKEFPHRESHSTLGSTFLNPTTAAGVAFGSGGTQVRKGPAYTERALYLKIHENKWKEVVVETINTLGIEGMEEDKLLTSQTGRSRKMDSIPSRLDTWSRWIQGGYERQMRYSSKTSPHGQAPASDVDYGHRLCQHHNSDNEDTVSRYNADTRGPDPNRSEGKVIILATVHDTFLKPQQTKTYWISFDSLATALKFRRQVCLSSPQDLPVSVEYMDRDSFDIIDRAGRFMAKTIQLTGTSSSIVQQLWKVKLWMEALPFDIAPLLPDYIFYYINPAVPSVLPDQVVEMGRKKDHHVALTMGDYGNGEMARFLLRLEKFVQDQGEEKIQLFECTKPSQAAGLTAFRFVAATAFRTWCVGNHMQGISVDYALPKTNGGSKPPLANGNKDTTQAVQPIKRMRYSHFGCNVVHEDLAYAPGVDVEAAKHAFKHAVEEFSAGKLPAEHGHGTEYHAPRETQERWKRMDPLNVLNPGIGGMSDKFKYKE